MPDYNFDSLTAIDFEELVRDLLQKELKIRLESFKSGKDLGIDFKIHFDNGTLLIIQCKHYQNTNYSTFINHLKYNELPKVIKLKPDRYILATSIGLSPQNKSQIKQIFEPFIINSSDILGFDDLNNLLRRNEDVVKNNFKLWFTSSEVLSQIIHSEVYRQSEMEIESLADNTKIFVKNRAFFEVERILKDNNLCIIVGIPGIGKTSIAKYLIARYSIHSYHIVSCATIFDAIKLFNPAINQFFYYDDFLGQTVFGDKLVKSEDKAIISFIDSIRKSKNSKFLLTTREYILNQARLTNERFDRADLSKDQYTVQLSDYSLVEKAMILYNHMWYANFPDELLENFLENKYYMQIIQHQNFTPRIVEIMTSGVIPFDKTYFKNFYENLENPERIWAHAFEYQISDAARNLLVVLATLPKSTFIDDTKLAFMKYHIAQSKKYGFLSGITDFNKAAKELEGTFTRFENNNRNHKLVINFDNPSIRDYLNNYIMNNRELISDLLSVSCYYQQNVIIWEIFQHLKTSYRISNFLYPSELLDSLKRTIDDRTLDYDQFFYIYSAWIPGLLNYALHERIEFVISIANKLESPDFDIFVDQLLTTLSERIVGKYDDRDLIPFIANLLKTDHDKYRFTFDRVRLFNAAKERYLNKLLDLDSFETVIDFFKSVNISPTPEECQFIKTQFEKYINADELTDFQKEGENFDNISLKIDIKTIIQTEDPNPIQEFIDQLKKIANYLEIDISSEIEILQDRYDELMIDYEPDFEDTYRDQRFAERSQEAYNKDREYIDALFSKLKE